MKQIIQSWSLGRLVVPLTILTIGIGGTLGAYATWERNASARIESESRVLAMANETAVLFSQMGQSPPVNPQEPMDRWLHELRDYSAKRPVFRGLAFTFSAIFLGAGITIAWVWTGRVPRPTT
jgi:hypothetical protein